MSSAGSSTSESNSSGSGVTLEHPTDALSIVQPLGYSASSCGYCAGRNAGRTRSGESGARPAKRGGLSYGCWAHRMTVKTYGDLLNLGWRRSGLYLYHPDNGSTCCPSLAIKLDAEAFTLSKSQRKLLRRFTGFMKDGVGEREGTEGWGGSVGEAKTTEEDSALSTALAVTFDPGQPRLEDQEEEGDYGGGKRKNVKSATALDKETEGKRSKGKNSGVQVDFLDLVHEGEWTREGTFRHKFEFKLEPASFSQEKYNLFHLYQTKIHGEPSSKVSVKGFKRFLCDTPLELEPTGSPNHYYGSHHGMYYLDGQLIAFTVLDILPTTISAVYCVYSPRWSRLEMGKVTALREIAMTREWNLALGRREDHRMDYKMGYYIHDCVKMRYKAAYQPSFLLDPETNRFYPWEYCKPLLDQDPHASFSRPRVSSSTSAIELDTARVSLADDAMSLSSESGNEQDEEGTVAWPAIPPLGALDPNNLPRDLVLGSCILEGNHLVPLMFSSAWNEKSTALEIKQCLAALRKEMTGRIALWVG